MEDDHVDRPGVEVQQCMKLTGTNSSIGLIVLITHVHLTMFIGFYLAWPAFAGQVMCLTGKTDSVFCLTAVFS